MDGYEVELGYLSYESSSDNLSIPIRIRERHLTPETKSASLQAIGPELQVGIWSERDDIVIRLPLRDWKTTKEYDATLSGANNGLLAVGRFEEAIENDGDAVKATVCGLDEL